MERIDKNLTGCYICKYSMWDGEGCFCKLNGAHPLAPSIGCDRQEVKQETDINSLYPKSILKPESNQLDTLEQRVDELSEEYDAVLKTHGDTLEKHMEQIEINEGNIEDLDFRLEEIECKIAAIYQFINSAAPGTFFNILEELKKTEKENVHNGSDFCGNCTHSKSTDGICTCKLNKGIVDPDDSSCPWFEPPF